MKIILFFFIYSILKGLQDYQMVYNSNSWRKKYAIGLKPIPKGLYGLYHQVNGLSYKEKFFLSGSLLVFLTDWWHLFDLLRIIAIALIITDLTGSFSLYWVLAYWIGFSLSYKVLRIKKGTE